MSNLWKCRHPIEVTINEKTNAKQHVACGQCTSCILKRAALWTGRNRLEWMDHACTGTFLTLTYSDQHYAVNEYTPVQLYLKRIRKLYDLRFYCAPDFGDQFGRFHWHLLLHGPDGSSTAVQDTLKSQWPLGTADVQPILTERIGYTCGYITKKLSGITTYRPRMSNGLGKSYFLSAGRKLAAEGRSLHTYPPTFKVGKSHYPLDKTCRAYILEGFINAGGVPAPGLGLNPPINDSDKIVYQLSREKLGGYHGDKATEKQHGIEKIRKTVTVTKKPFRSSLSD